LLPVRARIVICALGAVAAAGLCGQVASAATLTADYQFDDSFSSSVPGAGDIQTVGTGDKFVTETVGCTPQRVLSFPQHSGLQLANPNLAPPNSDNGNYSIVVLFRFSDLPGYRRIFDPSGFNSTTFTLDNGLYERNGALAIWDGGQFGNPFIGSPGVFEPDTYVEVAFTWDNMKGNKEPGYVDGLEALSSYAPGDSGSFYASGMRFFKDNDPPGVSNEDSAGAVARIRIYYGILSPQEVADVYAADKLTGACDPSKRARATINRKVKVKNGRNGRLVVLTGIDAACPAGGVCSGSAAVTRGGGSGRLAAVSKLPKKLGKAKLSVAAGKSKAVKVKLTRKASDALRAKGKLKVKISVSVSPPGGPAAVASRTAKLKPPH
jgi:hypothetical protein